MPFGFRLETSQGSARAGILSTDHGDVCTPAFMPVGTQAAVKAATPETLDKIGAQIILANAYHLFLRPGIGIVEDAGGLHSFMSWTKPILTDSGGFQVFSLADLGKVTDDGVEFQSHIDGSRHLFTPETVIYAQARLGADIVMSFDYCTPFPCDRTEAEKAVALTTKWAERGAGVFGTLFNCNGYEQALFGIVQGSVYEDLRRRSRDELIELEFPGYAIGGLSVGEEKSQTWKITECVTEGLPFEKPRYLMGVGTPIDIIEAVARGIDMFDCVLPTRNARNGTVFTRDGKLVLKNTGYSRDFAPLDSDCRCYACQNFSRAYLRHLFLAGEIMGPILATYHSLCFYCDLMKEMRGAIFAGCFVEWRRGFVERYSSGETRE
ncbi:MAG: tRNA guanosine(34) transglycosylase Tgt [Candidatus Latescibacteria bacterium]|nr:tRNA guanosine(34) transglycosylase Tgt [Candidatus Latescibacterota bacterium]NIM66505.1 tRNA guanosine(34) transglycosylase Tgt [Candidatus Latescibacterota bacterium]NIO02985.1 tRNA guanosine(34) transglycosylase Tgt [Candidatus Latescibacterota bacterium]NIO30120.1 tRNA guanosine(34) transglycosylase Tgt [Candidatus Latescibacterota bacterium]NIO57739.1 tRNA guanosine(34) transglycosylase Tgt [Candidatus Latescibacterota bacterium]